MNRSSNQQFKRLIRAARARYALGRPWTGTVQLDDPARPRPLRRPTRSRN